MGKTRQIRDNLIPMNIKINSAFLLAFSLVTSNVYADSVVDMSKYCSMPNGDILKTHCYSYISGIIDVQATYSLIRNNKILYTCVPYGVTARQGAEIFVKWTNNNPEFHHESAHKGIIQSLHSAFPCTSTEKKR